MKETWIRALRTFLQTAIGYFATNLVCATSGIAELGMKKSALMGLAVSAIAAGLSAAMNLPPKVKDPESDTGQGEDESGRPPVPPGEGDYENER